MQADRGEVGDEVRRDVERVHVRREEHNVAVPGARRHCVLQRARRLGVSHRQAWRAKQQALGARRGRRVKLLVRRQRRRLAGAKGGGERAAQRLRALFRCEKGSHRGPTNSEPLAQMEGRGPRRGDVEGNVMRDPASAGVRTNEAASAAKTNELLFKVLARLDAMQESLQRVEAGVVSNACTLEELKAQQSSNSREDTSAASRQQLWVPTQEQLAVAAVCAVFLSSRRDLYVARATVVATPLCSNSPRRLCAAAQEVSARGGRLPAACPPEPGPLHPGGLRAPPPGMPRPHTRSRPAVCRPVCRA